MAIRAAAAIRATMAIRATVALRAVAAATALLASLPGWTPLATAAPAERTRPTAVESMAKVPVDDARPTVRCWQYGRLVYEASNVQLIRESVGEGSPAADAPVAGSVPAAKGQRRVRVLDLHQGLCIVE